MSRRKVLYGIAGFTGGYAAYRAVVASQQQWGSPYPPPVREQARQALVQQQRGNLGGAQAHLHAALKECAQLRLPAGSSAVTGLQIKLAELQEAAGEPALSLRVLGEVFAALRADFEPAAKARERTEPALLKLVGVAQKMGDLHALLGDDEEAEGHYVWGVESILRFARATDARADAGPGAPDAILKAKSASITPLLDCLAHLYRRQGKLPAALHLFGLEHSLTPAAALPCRAMVVASNAAECALESGDRPGADRWMRTAAAHHAHHEAATGGVLHRLLWSRLSSTSSSSASENGALCASGSCVMFNSLGKLAELAGDKDAARGHYRRSAEIARLHGISQAAKEAEASLKTLE